MKRIHQNLTTEQKIQMLTTDFLDRDQTTFVKIRRTGRLGWESALPAGTPYSDYMLSPASDEELIKNSYRLAEDMIKIMDTPEKVIVRISPDGSKTDGKIVWVATEVFDDTDLPIGNRIDTFLGLAIHEGCHVLYTDFSAYTGITSRIVKFIENILEDERIERELGQKKPGLANFLKASKYYYFDRYSQKMKDEGKTEGLETFPRLMNAIISLVRYPKTVEMSDLEEFADTLLQVRELLTPYPSSTAQCVETAEKIFEIIKQYLQDEEKEKQKQQASDGTQDGQPSDESGEGDGSSGQSQQSQSDGKQVKPKKMTSRQIAKKVDQQMNEIFEQIADALKELTSEPEKKTINAQNQSETVKADRNLVGKICEGRAERGSQKGCVVMKATPNQDKYNDSLSRVRRYIPAISKSLKCSSMEYKLIHRGMRSGMLDTGKIAEAYQGVPTVYMREGQVKSDRISVCILIDESGSMYGDGETAARDTAVLLNEAIGTLQNVDLYIYGHSTDVGTVLYVYREKSFCPKYAIGSTDSRWGNNDGTAIREAASRVRRHTRENCLFFMISDGAPNESVEEVRQAVLDVEKQGFAIVAVSIEPMYDPSLMYHRNVNLTDMSRLAVDLGKMVKKAIADNTRRKIQ
ncbi:MAG: VWA domain-containing protein [Bacteroidales bacterium]|nr:VWA domain-containing protein [Bacteroidales bacterium]